MARRAPRRDRRLLALGFALGARGDRRSDPLPHRRRLAAADGERGVGLVVRRAMLRVTLLLVPAALLEELMTRGYILSVLRDWWGWRWAIIATSVAFGLLHLANNGATRRVRRRS